MFLHFHVIPTISTNKQQTEKQNKKKHEQELIKFMLSNSLTTFTFQKDTDQKCSKI